MKALAHNIYFNALLAVRKARMPPGSPKGLALPELAAPSMFQPAGPPSNDEARERLAPCGSQSPWQRKLTRPRSLNRCRFLRHEASGVSSPSPPRSPPNEMRRRRPTTGRREKRRGEPAKQTENRAPWFLLNDGRGERIRTPGLRYPKPSRYQTALRPDARFLAGFFRNEKA